MISVFLSQMKDPKELVTYSPTPVSTPVCILQSLCRIISFHLQMISKAVSPDGACGYTRAEQFNLHSRFLHSNERFCFFL